MTITMISQVQNRPTNVFTESLYAGYDKMIKIPDKRQFKNFETFSKAERV